METESWKFHVASDVGNEVVEREELDIVLREELDQTVRSTKDKKAPQTDELLKWV